MPYYCLKSDPPGQMIGGGGAGRVGFYLPMSMAQTPWQSMNDLIQAEVMTVIAVPLITDQGPTPLPSPSAAAAAPRLPATTPLPPSPPDAMETDQPEGKEQEEEQEVEEQEEIMEQESPGGVQGADSPPQERVPPPPQKEVSEEEEETPETETFEDAIEPKPEPIEIPREGFGAAFNVPQKDFNKGYRVSKLTSFDKMAPLLEHLNEKFYSKKGRSELPFLASPPMFNIVRDEDESDVESRGYVTVTMPPRTLLTINPSVILTLFGMENQSFVAPGTFVDRGVLVKQHAIINQSFAPQTFKGEKIGHLMVPPHVTVGTFMPAEAEKVVSFSFAIGFLSPKNVDLYNDENSAAHAGGDVIEISSASSLFNIMQDVVTRALTMLGLNSKLLTVKVDSNFKIITLDWNPNAVERGEAAKGMGELTISIHSLLAKRMGNALHTFKFNPYLSQSLKFKIPESMPMQRRRRRRRREAPLGRVKFSTSIPILFTLVGGCGLVVDSHGVSRPPAGWVDSQIVAIGEPQSASKSGQQFKIVRSNPFKFPVATRKIEFELRSANFEPLPSSIFEGNMFYLILEVSSN